MHTGRHWLHQKLIAYACPHYLKAVAREFGCSRNTVRKWVRRYEPGRPSREASNRNCVAATRGGEQRNENGQSVTPSAQAGGRRKLDSVGGRGRASGGKAKPVSRR
jgi:transposase-like protein